MRVQHQLVGRRVIEDGHLLRADHHQALLLERMKPAHEDVRTDAAGKDEMAERDIGHVLAEVVAAFTCGDPRLLAEQGQEHADIMRRETPEDVFLGPDLAHIESVGVDIFDPSQLARC